MGIIVENVMADNIAENENYLRYKNQPFLDLSGQGGFFLRKYQRKKIFECKIIASESR